MRVYVGRCDDTDRTNKPNTLTLLRLGSVQNAILISRNFMQAVSLPPRSDVRFERAGPRVAPLRITGIVKPTLVE